MSNHIITDAEIASILDKIKQRKTLEARKILNELPEDELPSKIRTIIRNAGRSTHINVAKLKEALGEQ